MIAASVTSIFSRLLFRHAGTEIRQMYTAHRFWLPKVKLSSLCKQNLESSQLFVGVTESGHLQINQVRYMAVDYAKEKDKEKNKEKDREKEIKSQYKLSFNDKLQRLLGFKGGMKATPKQLQGSGIKLFFCFHHHINATDFIIDLEMPDTFNSWFRVVQLHMWLLMVRLSREGTEGVYIRNQLISQMWQDASNRALSITKKSVTGESLEFYSHSFWTAVISYDEGLLGDDKMLASALWNILFQKRNVHPKHLELMVGYVRKQIQHLDQQTSDDIVHHGVVTFLPMYGDRLDPSTLNSEQLKSIQQPKTDINQEQEATTSSPSKSST